LDIDTEDTKLIVAVAGWGVVFGIIAGFLMGRSKSDDEKKGA
jgi:hypothetical protein